MQDVIGILLSIILLVGSFVLAQWLVRRRDESRRSKELRDPQRRFHWGVIAGYKGDADPTRLSAEEAKGILNDWSCPELGRLRSKVDLYRRGEVNDAFDVARILWLGELGIAAGWVTQVEVSGWSEEGLARLRRAYSGWQAYGEAVSQGLERWYTEVARTAVPESARERDRAARDAAARLWRSIPW